VIAAGGPPPPFADARPMGSALYFMVIADRTGEASPNP
jgi:hypothetical protein